MQIIICVSSEKLSKIPVIISARNQTSWNNQMFWEFQRMMGITICALWLICLAGKPKNMPYTNKNYVFITTKWREEI
ncbi:MAG: hypothetical protein COW26_03290 [Nitrosopumilales archaeon CG15_BIG_FIL_POST_REV_8_21_14_020_33_23]|nr:MAG: hypothetical protein COV65_03170 [Nitrosopumilales archaeon CG11_big_fil_rev_8_21_14_0_20_33_24]PIW35651.1 MAG: hypothetical protein COW26_03290 [Nitrosopumilales archaeon CG15_BIG_FIL_POST_REV_8_21_14_020_33_23]PJB96828.1 MAG: hypothetical protein CO079_09015 [Nitrosopumilales archaeon CG_4_9_14_0_8_um_filter_34_10]